MEVNTNASLGYEIPDVDSLTERLHFDCVTEFGPYFFPPVNPSDDATMKKED